MGRVETGKERRTGVARTRVSPEICRASETNGGINCASGWSDCVGSTGSVGTNLLWRLIPGPFGQNPQLLLISRSVRANRRSRFDIPKRIYATALSYIQKSNQLAKSNNGHWFQSDLGSYAQQHTNHHRQRRSSAQKLAFPEPLFFCRRQI